MHSSECCASLHSDPTPDKLSPDILVLQETKCQDQDFPIAQLQEAGYHVAFTGQVRECSTRSPITSAQSLHRRTNHNLGVAVARSLHT